MAGALQLIARLQAAPVPPVPPCKNSGEPLEAAPLLEVPPVPPVPSQKHNTQNQCENTTQQVEWLARVARLLGCSPEYLLERRFLLPDELAMYCNTHPRIAASTISSHPNWHQQLEHSAHAREEACEQCEPLDVVTLAAPSGHCPRCFPRPCPKQLPALLSTPWALLCNRC